MSILAKKVAVITGGATGIGQATTVRLHTEYKISPMASAVR